MFWIMVPKMHSVTAVLLYLPLTLTEFLIQVSSAVDTM